MAKRILKLSEVEARVGLKKTTIYKSVQAGTFPAPIALGGKARGWVDSEIDQWIEERIADTQNARQSRHYTPGTTKHGQHRGGDAC
jgi:prophage regulatory protein